MFFSNGIIQIWNNPPDSVIYVNNINAFKNKLDKLWANENMKFNFKWRSHLTSWEAIVKKFIIVIYFL